MVNIFICICIFRIVPTHLICHSWHSISNKFKFVPFRCVLKYVIVATNTWVVSRHSLRLPHHRLEVYWNLLLEVLLPPPLQLTSCAMRRAIFIFFRWIKHHHRDNHYNVTFHYNKYDVVKATVNSWLSEQAASFNKEGIQNVNVKCHKYITNFVARFKIKKKKCM